MARKKLYASGTMKVADINGELIPFNPSIKSECVTDHVTGKTLDAVMLEVNDSIEQSAAVNDSIQVFNSEPKDSVYNSAMKESMIIVFDEVDTWELTVKSVYGTTSDKYPSSGYYTGIPFQLYSCTGSSLKVDWGDGTTSNLTPSSYTSGSSTASLHKYTGDSGPTVHKIKISSPDFSKTALLAFTGAIATGTTVNVPVLAFRKSLISIDSPVPGVSQTYVFTPTYTYVYSSYLYSNTLQYLFYDCTELESICSGIFDYHPNATNFSYIFGLNSNLETSMKLAPLPLRLFRCNTAMQNVDHAFYGRAFSTLPEDIFKYASSAITFQHAFNSRSVNHPFQSLPANLLWYNKNITTLNYCYIYCREFELRIGSSKISYADDFMRVYPDAPELDPSKRIIYVPKDSTTYYTFSAVAEIQKLTVVGV